MRESAGETESPDSSDSAAVAQALAKCIAAKAATLYFPAGVYRLDRRLEVALAAGSSLAIRGNGPGLTRIIWTTDIGGIDVRFKPDGGFDGVKGAILIEGLTLLTTKPAGGSAIRLTSDGGSSPMPKKLVRDVVLAGESEDAGWTIGVDCIDCTFVTIDGVDFHGPGTSGTAIRFAGEHDPVDNYITRLRVHGGGAGVEVTGACEGVYLAQSTLIGVERGVHWHTPRGEPLLSMSGCHVAASRECVLGHNLIQPIITGNLFYQSPGVDAGAWTGIRLSADEPSIYDLLQVADNTIHGFPSAGGPRTGIAITSRTGGIIRGNVIHGVETGISLDEKTSEVRVLDNVIRPGSRQDIADAGQRNVVRK